MRNLWAAVAAALRRWLARDDLRTKSRLRPPLLTGDAAAQEVMQRWVTTLSRSLVVLFGEDGVVERARMLTPAEAKKVRALLHVLDVEAASPLRPMTNGATPTHMRGMS